MREIVLDTETTGLSPEAGDRIVEIGCVELINHMPTGRTFHRHINPERDMPVEAEAIHGLSGAFLADKPRFAEVVDDFLEFIACDHLVIHNAEFDLRFLNAELVRCGRSRLQSGCHDTLLLARRAYPGAQASLDALCRRFQIDTSKRDKHGAIIDCELLAAVYLELAGGREPAFLLAQTSRHVAMLPMAERRMRPPRPHMASPAELAAHAQMLGRLKEPVWLKYSA